MSAPPLPPSIEMLGHRHFSFYPPILNVEHNEWRYLKATWSEILVANTKSGDELWLSHRYIAELSSIDEPVMILGLKKELEYSGGQVLPHVRKVIEMPRAAAIDPATHISPVQQAPVIGIRLEGGTESRVGRLILTTMVVGVVTCVAIVGSFRIGRDGSNISFAPVLQSNLNLAWADEFVDVVRKLGPPAEDHWKNQEGTMQYRVLRYPDKGISVILMGEERPKARYIGSFDKDWKPVHSVVLPGGKNTSSTLRSLARF